jgi:hypothetical protein
MVENTKPQPRAARARGSYTQFNAPCDAWIGAPAPTSG